MYETVIWVAMMGAIFSYILELVYRQRVIAIGGATVAVLATIVADAMPPEFGNNIRNLTPVLRSNYWLTIHVLTIVSSYAAFALALVLGNIVLGQFIYGKSSRAVIAQNLQFTYRAVQIGVLLVAAGTILGGLWADVSWGRFWGWDPKEVWALIVLLTYLALLHGRYAGWIKQFGTAAGAVICFTAVVMSWYGVNFVLGAGLHAYGFNTGGQEYVAAFVLAQWAYVAFAWMVYKGRQRSDLPPGAGKKLAVEENNLPGAMPVTGK
jgi:ABC-type transport system involved in cytochrome c biogenesis permease subunit